MARRYCAAVGARRNVSRARRLSRHRACGQFGKRPAVLSRLAPDCTFVVAIAGPHGAIRVGTGGRRTSGARIHARRAGAYPDAGWLRRAKGNVAATGTSRAAADGSAARGRDGIYRDIQGAENGARALGHGHVRALVSNQGAHAGDATARTARGQRYSQGVVRRVSGLPRGHRLPAEWLRDGAGESTVEARRQPAWTVAAVAGDAPRSRASSAHSTRTY